MMEMTMAVNYATTRESYLPLDEGDLVSAAQKGDLEAFNHLVQSYRDRIFTLAARILGDEDAAEDVAQDAFLSAYRNLGGFRKGSFRSWLYRIATNLCYDELRRRKRRPVLSLEYEDEAEERLMEEFISPDPGDSPEKAYEKYELEQVVQKALNALDTDQRMVVVLIDQQDFDYQEAAQILGVPIGTVKSRLARARAQLRGLLNLTSFRE